MARSWVDVVSEHIEQIEEAEERLAVVLAAIKNIPEGKTTNVL